MNLDLKLIEDLILDNSNDSDLGEKYRNLCSLNGGLDDFCLKHTNDYELGYIIRNTFLK